MVRTFAAAFVSLLILTGSLSAQDRDLKARLVAVDPVKQTVTVQTEDGKKMTYAAGAGVKVTDAKGAMVKDGLKDKGLMAGASVKLVLTGTTVKAVQVLTADKVAAKPEPGKKDTPKAPADKGTPAKVVKVDAATRTVQVEVEGGKKVQYNLGADVKFIGPRGGASDKGIKDDRFVAGSTVGIVLDKAGKTVTEIHLPVRKSE